MLLLISTGHATSLANGYHTRSDGASVATIRLDSQKPIVAFRRCLPATGAQVLGGFASPHDWLDPDTDEICDQW
jgi:hypothetical protein